MLFSIFFVYSVTMPTSFCNTCHCNPLHTTCIACFSCRRGGMQKHRRSTKTDMEPCSTLQVAADDFVIVFDLLSLAPKKASTAARLSRLLSKVGRFGSRRSVESQFFKSYDWVFMVRNNDNPKNEPECETNPPNKETNETGNMMNCVRWFWLAVIGRCCCSQSISVKTCWAWLSPQVFSHSGIIKLGFGLQLLGSAWWAGLLALVIYDLVSSCIIIRLIWDGRNHVVLRNLPVI